MNYDELYALYEYQREKLYEEQEHQIFELHNRLHSRLAQLSLWLSEELAKIGVTDLAEIFPKLSLRWMIFGKH